MAPLSYGSSHKGRQTALEEIERSVAHKTWLQRMRDEESVLNSRIERKESQLNAAHNEIYQLLGLFFVFQGVILTAVAQAQALHCRHCWSPLALSILASVATLAALLRKLADLQNSQQKLLDDKGRSAALFDFILRFYEKGANFDLEADPGRSNDLKLRSTSRISKENAAFLQYKFAIVAVVVVFALVIAASCVVILCH